MFICINQALVTKFDAVTVKKHRTVCWGGKEGLSNFEDVKAVFRPPLRLSKGVSGVVADFQLTSVSHMWHTGILVYNDLRVV